MSEYETIDVKNSYAIAELSKAEKVLEKAKLIVITSHEMATEAQKELASIKGLQKEIEASRVEKVAPLNTTVKSINDAFRKPAEFLSSAESIIKNAISVYLREQERLAREKQAKLEEAARKEKAELEAKAVKAEVKGKVETAEVLRETATNVVTPIIQSGQKLTGVSVRKSWKGIVDNKAEFVKAALKRPDMMALISIDEAKLTKLAAALQGELSMPGVKTYQEETLAARSA